MGGSDFRVSATDIQYFNNIYCLYYTILDVADATSGELNCGGDSAIGLATSSNTLGPWTDSGAPVVASRRNSPRCNFFWTFDPEIVQDNTRKYIFYGSIQARTFPGLGKNHSNNSK